MTGDSGSDRRRALRVLERTLLLVGLAALGWYAALHVVGRLDQASQNTTLERLRAERAAPASGPPRSDAATPAPGPAPRRARPAPHELIGRVDIPRLGLSAIVREGVDEGTLRRAVGHVPDTALPGEKGNAALAAHRDTFFRPLKQIRRGDRIQVTTPDGTHEYRVTETRVVDPEDVWVLDPTPQPTLTLVTCYPFNFVGSAPRRFIVRAAAARAAGTRVPTAARPLVASAAPPAVPMLPADPTPPRRAIVKTTTPRRAVVKKTSPKPPVRKASLSKKAAATRPAKKEKAEGWKLFGIFKFSHKNVGS